jgi:hypothetical protein
VHYDEAVFLQKLRRQPFWTKKRLIEVFIATFPYGAGLFKQTEKQYKSHVENNIQSILDFIEPHNIKVIDGLFERPEPDLPLGRTSFQAVLYAREDA